MGQPQPHNVYFVSFVFILNAFGSLRGFSGSANGKGTFGGLSSSFTGASSPASTEFKLSVSPSFHISASFKDIRASSSVFTDLGAPTITGKLYGRDATNILLITIEPVGAAARVVLGAKAAPREEAAFAQLYQRLEGDSMVCRLVSYDYDRTLTFSYDICSSSPFTEPPRLHSVPRRVQLSVTS